MSLRTGENEQGLKKIIDMIRLIAIVVLLIHCYYFCYAAFEIWGFTSSLSDQLLANIGRTGLLIGFLKSKTIALGLLLLSLLGIKGKKDEKFNLRAALAYLFTGLILYYLSGLFLIVPALDPEAATIAYMSIAGLGFILILTGGGLLTRIIKNKLKTDVFNKANETFPQEERLLTNEFSINLPAQYNLKNKTRRSWVNVINPARGVLVVGSPGSGKSRFFVEPAIRQLIEKGHALFIYDYKYPDLSALAYDHYQKHKDKYKVAPTFWTIDLDNIMHRCNPIAPNAMYDITDAAEAARIIMLGLSRSWVKRQGEFFVESPINFVTAIIWFLRKYENGLYCTLPHVIEMMMVDMDKLFTVLRTEPEILAYINPFISAFLTNSMEQLEGQIDSAKISMARLSSPTVYYVLSGNDFTLDINNPQAPKIVTLANNPQKQETFGPILSLYMTRMAKIINRAGQLKSGIVLDEFATLTFLGLDTLIATGRSNKISTILALQSDNQLRLNYGREWADVVTNICGNLIVGQISGDFAKSVSERMGKTLQDRENISINSSDTSISRSKQLEAAVPVSTIASLSSGEFVGMVADNPNEIIEQKIFHSRFIVNDEAVSKEQLNQEAKPLVEKPSPKVIQDNYLIIRQDVQDIVELVMEQVLNDPGMEHMIVKK